MKLLHIILQYLIIPQFSERDLVGINADTSRLVVLASVSDFDENLPLSRGLLRKHPHLQLYSRLLDSHIYVLRKWVCDFLGQERYVFFSSFAVYFFFLFLNQSTVLNVANRSLGTLKGELLPYIVRKQSSKPAQKVEDAPIMGGNAKKGI